MSQQVNCRDIWYLPQMMENIQKPVFICVNLWL